MTDDRAVRMALAHAALVVAVRRYVAEHRTHCPCLLCEALAEIDRPKP